MKIERLDFIEFSNAAVVIAGRKPYASAKAKDEPPPPPTFSEEELKAAEKAAYQKGFLEGEKEGRKQAESEQAMVDRKLTDLVEKFAKRVMPLFEDYRKMALAVRAQAPKLALAVSKKVAGQALDQNAQVLVEDMALRALETLMKEPKLSVTVHESLGDTLSKRLEQLAARLQSAADIVILRDPAMPAADFRIEWNQGGIERQTAQLWQQVEKVIEEMGTTATRETKEDMEALRTEMAPKKDDKIT